MDLPQSVGELRPGDVIKLADLTELVAFEDLVVAQVEPWYDHDLWESRVHLREYIRVPRFNGTIANIALTVMADAYERLVSAGERGLKNSAGRGWDKYRLSEQRAEEYALSYVGFEFTADGRSSRDRRRRQIQTEMWYYPFFSPARRSPGETYTRTLKTDEGERVVTCAFPKRNRPIAPGRNVGLAIGRVIANPKLEMSAFRELDQSSRAFGYATLRFAMKHPYRG